MGLRDVPHRLSYSLVPRLGSALRKRWVKLANPRARIEFGAGVHVGPGFRLHIPAGGSFIVGERTEFRHGFRAEIHDEGRIVIGRECVFTYDPVIQCSTLIEIGDRCQMGQASIIVDGQHRFRDMTVPMLEQGFDFQEIRIGDDTSITSKCTVMASIGERVFLGANSVVTKELPPYSLAVGAPARVIESFSPPQAQSPDATTLPSAAPGASTQAAR